MEKEKFNYSIPIRGLNKKLYQQAQADVRLRSYKNIGEWVNEAIGMKLALSGVKFYIDSKGRPTLESPQGGKVKLIKGKWGPTIELSQE